MVEKSDESVFNMALAYLQRIDKILYICQEASINQDIPSWISALRSFFRELTIKLDDTEMDEILGKNKPLIRFDVKNLDYSPYVNFKNINYLFNNPLYSRQYRNIILYLLDALEIKLRKLMQKRGMGLPSKDNPAFAVLKR